MVFLELPTALSVGKGGKYEVKAIWQWQTDLATEIFSMVTEFGCH